MQEISVHIKNDRMVIYDHIRKSNLWSMNISSLLDTRGGNLSNWILHLEEKSWISNPLLYKVARIINEQHPDNDIDWESTFFLIEKGLYLDNLAKIEGIYDDLIARMELGITKNREEVNKKIERIVKKKLHLYKIRA